MDGVRRSAKLFQCSFTVSEDDGILETERYNNSVMFHYGGNKGMTATLTCNRGKDRPQLMEFCNVQLDRLNPYPDMVIIVQYEPTSNQVDLIPRMKKGVQIAKGNGVETIYVVESDDYYCPNYFEQMAIGDYDFIGYNNTVYYNIKKRTWERTYHDHSSLFCTAFKVAALDNFVWPPDDYLWLDIALWKYAKQNNKKWKLIETDNPCIGIKHGVGKVGGKGHVQNLKNADPELKWLKGKVDNEAFEFYSNLKLL